MTGFGRWLRVGLIAAGWAAAGCATRPYAGDPLLHDRRGVWGDLSKSAATPPTAAPEPAAPQAPTGPTIADPPDARVAEAAVTSP